MDAAEPVGAGGRASEPWNSPGARAIAAAILASHRRWTGADLIPIQQEDTVDPAQALYHAPIVVLAHDGAEDPRFIYANRSAQQLWERPWSTFIGLPSRLTAEPDERASRQRMLEAAGAQGFADGYRGLRVSASGRRFWIEDARLWNVLDATSARIGQAARFSRWQAI